MTISTTQDNNSDEFFKDQMNCSKITLILSSQPFLAPLQTSKDTDPKDFKWVDCNIPTRIIIDHVSTNQTPNYVNQNRVAISTLYNLVIRLSVCKLACHKILLKKQEMVFFQKPNNHGQNKPLTILPITPPKLSCLRNSFEEDILKVRQKKKKKFISRIPLRKKTKKLILCSTFSNEGKDPKCI